LGPEAERRISIFTSALPNEGKSFTSANYSLALAQQGYRVLLIDGDLRRPNMHKIFRFPELSQKIIPTKTVRRE
jgi:ATPases involved in chromosome partitioning